MDNCQFIGIYIALLAIMVVTEWGLLTICKHLKDIERELKRRADNGHS